MCLFVSGSLLARDPNPVRTISADLHKSQGPMNRMFNACVGAGRANEGLRADWQAQLQLAKQECGFRYIRMHGLLSDDMGVYREDHRGSPVYNFQYIDALYDFLLETGIKPFVELGFMPGALASGTETIFWWRGNVTPPKSYQKWEDLIYNLVRHFTQRYGEEEVMSWYFEVWNEPNLSPGFWTGTQQEYFKLYAHAARAVKAVNPRYRVGGPATAGAAWVPETIAFCTQNGVPIDFISTHAYGVDVGFLDEFGGTGTRLSKNPMSVSGEVMQSRRQIEESPMPHLELHYTEWSSSYTPADPIHDSYHQAAYILQKLKQAGAAAQSMSYWVFTDIFEEAGPRFTPFHGGFGLMNTQGIRKPVFHAYSFLNRMGETELANSDAASWVCKDRNGDFQLLCWDYTHTLPHDSVNNQDFYIRNLPAHPKEKLRIDLKNIPAGNYRLDVHRIGYRHNDPYTAYAEMNRPGQLTVRQVDFLKQLSTGNPESTELVSIGTQGTFQRELVLHENEVILYRFIKL